MRIFWKFALTTANRWTGFSHILDTYTSALQLFDPFSSSCPFIKRLPLQTSFLILSSTRLIKRHHNFITKYLCDFFKRHTSSLYNTNQFWITKAG